MLTSELSRSDQCRKGIPFLFCHMPQQWEWMYRLCFICGHQVTWQLQSSYMYTRPKLVGIISNADKLIPSADCFLSSRALGYHSLHGCAVKQSIIVYFNLNSCRILYSTSSNNKLSSSLRSVWSLFNSSRSLGLDHPRLHLQMGGGAQAPSVGRAAEGVPGPPHLHRCCLQEHAEVVRLCCSDRAHVFLRLGWDGKPFGIHERLGWVGVS